MNINIARQWHRRRDQARELTGQILGDLERRAWFDSDDMDGLRVWTDLKSAILEMVDELSPLNPNQQGG